MSLITATEGGEQRLITNSSLPFRPRPRWPEGVRVVLFPVLHFEAMDVDVPQEASADPRWRERPAPDLRYNSFYEYGNRIAMHRLLALFDRLGLTLTVAANAMACERCPDLVEAFKARGYELAAHGLAANRMISVAMSAAQERAFITESLARFEAATGARSRGWFGQDFGQSERTPALLAEQGLAWQGDWPNDDEPCRMAGAGGLVSLPVAYEWDDMRLFIERRMQAWYYPVMLREAFALFDREGRERPRVLPLSIHPWVFGAPHRLRYLDETLSALCSAPGVWIARASELAACAAP